MANTNDGTVLGTGEVISDEYIDPNQNGRGDASLPQTGYKVPRSKIAVGPYGQDEGDVSASNPLPVDEVSWSLADREESRELRDRDNSLMAMRVAFGERISLADSRGSHFTNRGVR